MSPLHNTITTNIFVNNRVIGKVEGDTFYKNIRTNHILHTPLAIAFDLQSLEDATRAGASRVQVRDKDSGIIYKAAIDHIRRAGFTFNRGCGNQIALGLDNWIREKPGGGLPISPHGPTRPNGPLTIEPSQPRRQPKVEQPSLFPNVWGA
jgi:hypothetical protein